MILLKELVKVVFKLFLAILLMPFSLPMWLFLVLRFNLRHPYKTRLKEKPVISILDLISQDKEINEVHDFIRERYFNINGDTAIFLYQWVLDLFPIYLPKLQKNIALDLIKLGDVLQSLPFGDQETNLIVAVAAYEASLNVFKAKKFPREWSIALRGIGEIYTKYQYSSVYEPVLRRLIEAQGSLCFFLTSLHHDGECGRLSREKFKRYGFGKYYDNRIEVAIDFYEGILTTLKRKQYPYDWAKIMIALGDAKQVLYKKAPIYHKNSILGNESDKFSKPKEEVDVIDIDGSTIRWNYRNFIEESLSNRIWVENYRRIHGNSIEYYRQALEEITQDLYPEDWADLQIKIGDSYRDCTQDELNENLRNALSCYQKALEVFSEDHYITKWAIVQYSLGLTYKEQKQFTEATRCLERALQVFVSQNMERLCTIAGEELGDIAFNTEQWVQAIEGYATAIAAAETNRKFITSESCRRKIAYNLRSLYQRVIGSLVNSNQLMKAVEYTERSFAIQLNDLIITNYFASNNKELEEEFGRLQKMHDTHMRFESRIAFDNLIAFSEGLSQEGPKYGLFNQTYILFEQRKAELYEMQRRVFYEKLLSSEKSKTERFCESLNFKDIQALINKPTTAALVFYTIQKDTYIFVIRQKSIDLHICNQHSLQEWIFENWLSYYKNNNQVWQDGVESFLIQLSQRLGLFDLFAKYLKNIQELILIPDRYLHIIPFSALPIECSPNNEIQYLSDNFSLRYVPNFKLLKFCHQRSGRRRYELQRMGIIENPLEDLIFSSFECGQISQMFNVPREHYLRGREATVNSFRCLLQDEQLQAIHLSMHSESRLRNALESVLKLAREDSGQGMFTPRQVSLGQLLQWQMPSVEEVFLAGCETNLGDIPDTNDILTLGTGFLVAGASKVISSLWKVDDLATSLISIFYYQERQKGLDCPTALQNAQIRLRTLTGIRLKYYLNGYVEFLDKLAREMSDYDVTVTVDALKIKLDQLYDTEKPFSSPLYWAAFVCQG
jgi:CHAT domain-containing protein